MLNLVFFSFVGCIHLCVPHLSVLIASVTTLRFLDSFPSPILFALCVSSFSYLPSPYFLRDEILIWITTLRIVDAIGVSSYLFPWWMFWGNSFKQGHYLHTTSIYFPSALESLCRFPYSFFLLGYWKLHKRKSQQSINIFLTVFDSRNTCSEFVFVSKSNNGMTNWGKWPF